MTILTYDNLLKEVESYINRDDLTEKLPLFIAIAETEMYNNETQPLVVRDMESVITVVTSASRYVDLPDNYESSRSINIEIDGFCKLIYKTPEALNVKVGTGRPIFFTISGNRIELDILPDTSYSININCYVRPDDLSVSNQTNSVLTKYPNIYLFGAVSEAFTYAADLNLAQIYNLRFMNAIKGANKSQKRGRYGAAPYMNTDLVRTP